MAAIRNLRSTTRCNRNEEKIARRKIIRLIEQRDYVGRGRLGSVLGFESSERGRDPKELHARLSARY